MQGLTRIGGTPGPGESVVSFGVSTGILLPRNDRSAPQVSIAPVSDALVAALADAAAEAAEESALRSLITVVPGDGTAEFPVFRTRR